MQHGTGHNWLMFIRENPWFFVFLFFLCSCLFHVWPWSPPLKWRANKNKVKYRMGKRRWETPHTVDQPFKAHPYVQWDLFLKHTIKRSTVDVKSSQGNGVVFLPYQKNKREICSAYIITKTRSVYRVCLLVLSRFLGLIERVWEKNFQNITHWAYDKKD